MANERVQRRIERLLDQLDEAESQGNWESVRDLAQDVLEIDPDNTEAGAYLRSLGSITRNCKYGKVQLFISSPCLETGCWAYWPRR